MILTIGLIVCHLLLAHPSDHASDSIPVMSTIRVKVDCDKVEWLNSGIYENFYIEPGPRNSRKKFVDSLNKSIEFEYNLKKPSMIELHTNVPYNSYRIYLKPGDVLDVTVGCDDISYSGSSKAENIALQRLGLNYTNLIRPKLSASFSTSPDNDSVGIYERSIALKAHYDSIFDEVSLAGFDDDFTKYIKAERIGINYFWKHTMLYHQVKDTVGIDSLNEKDKGALRELFELPFIDECRSRYYCNALSAYLKNSVSNTLPPKSRDNYYIFLAEIQKQNEQIGSFSEDLKIMKDVGLINTAVFKATDIQHLDYAAYLLENGRSQYPTQQGALDVIEEDLNRKRIRFELDTLKDYTLTEQQDSSSIRLSEAIGSSEYALFYIWATWCAPCLKSMPEVFSLERENIKVIPLCVWSNNTAWNEKIAQKDFQYPNHLFANKTLSDEIAYDCSLTSVPLYVIVDRNLKIIQIPSGLTDAKMILQELSTRP